MTQVETLKRTKSANKLSALRRNNAGLMGGKKPKYSRKKKHRDKDDGGVPPQPPVS